MGQYKKLWYTLFGVLAVTFCLLGYLGKEVYRQAPPFPEKYVSASGQTLITKDDILKGQSAWQSTGGMELGSVLGHGSYQAPDWTADFLHRELVMWLDLTAQKDYGKKFDDLSFDQKAIVQARLKQEYREQSAMDSSAQLNCLIHVPKRLKKFLNITLIYMAIIQRITKLAIISP